MNKKQILTLLLSCFIILNILSQNSNPLKKVNPELQSTTDILFAALIDKTTWSLWNFNKSLEYAPTNGGHAIKRIDTFLAKIPVKNEMQGQIKEFNLIKKYRDNIESAYSSLQYFGGYKEPASYLSGGSYSPIRFFLHKENQLSIMMLGAYIPQIYSINKLTSRERAEKVINGYLLSTLKTFSENFNSNEIKYYGITFIYGSKDELNDYSPANAEAEAIGFLVNSKIVEKYLKNEITEEKLVDSADIYISDRDMYEMKKIKIILK